MRQRFESDEGPHAGAASAPSGPAAEPRSRRRLLGAFTAAAIGFPVLGLLAGCGGEGDEEEDD